MNSLPIAVVIVSYNGQEWIRECLKSLADCLRVTQIIVVDNASADKTCQIIQTEFPAVNLIQLPRNTGFGFANNVGISLALRSEIHGVLLLNQDARVAPDMVQQLATASDKSPHLGILSPLQLNYDGSLIHRGFLKYLAMSCNEYLTAAAMSRPLDVYDFPNAPAAIWYLPKNTLKSVGGFDPLFFVYCEDSDYVNRTFAAGLKMALVPSAVGFHDDTPAQPSRKNVFMLFESQQKIFLKSCGQLLVGYSRVARRCLIRMLVDAGSLNVPDMCRTLKVFFRLVVSVAAVRKSRSKASSGAEYLFLDKDVQV